MMSYRWPMINAKREAKEAQYSIQRIERQLLNERKRNDTIMVLLLEFLNDTDDIMKAKEMLLTGLQDTNIVSLKDKSEEE